MDDILTFCHYKMTIEQQGALKIGQFYPERLIENLNSLTEMAAFKVLKQLERLNANIVTVESLTCGQIVKTLADVPMYGPYIYGGLITYDSDAKRMFVNARHGDVYTDIMAGQMAEGALIKSRAVVAVSVTGQARSLDPATMGHVDVGLAIRGSFTKTKHLDLCKDSILSIYCDKYFQEISDAKLAGRPPFPHPLSSSLIGNLIRTATTLYALEWTAEELTKLSEIDAELPFMCYDGDYKDYGEPSFVIMDRLVQKRLMRSSGKSSSKRSSVRKLMSSSNLARFASSVSKSRIV
jgi:nicotinamide mononucleotide (NMN) deamidase PncC